MSLKDDLISKVKSELIIDELSDYEEKIIDICIDIIHALNGHNEDLHKYIKDLEIQIKNNKIVIDDLLHDKNDKHG